MEEARSEETSCSGRSGCVYREDGTGYVHFSVATGESLPQGSKLSRSLRRGECVGGRGVGGQIVE